MVEGLVGERFWLELKMLRDKLKTWNHEMFGNIE